LTVNRALAGHLEYVLEVRNDQGDVVWFSDRLPLTAARVPFNVPIPDSGVTLPNQNLFLHVRVWHQNSAKFLPLDDGQESLRLCRIQSSTVCAHHFSLLEELPGNLRLYRNESALPPAYLVFRTTRATSREEAIQLMSHSAFDWHSTAIVESSDGAGLLSPSPAMAAAEQFKPAPVRRPGPNEVIAESESSRAGLLVLTDSYYPGWNAYIDNRPAPIVRVNYLFRGVEVPAGRHTVTFKFEPISVAAGLAIFALFTVGLGVYGIRRTMSRRTTRRTHFDASGWQETAGANGGIDSREDLRTTRTRH
jgi:hypothetical protein